MSRYFIPKQQTQRLDKSVIKMKILTYEEFLDYLGLVKTELSELIYSLYQTALEDEKRKDNNSGKIYRDL